MHILFVVVFLALICVNKIFVFETSKNHLCIQKILIKLEEIMEKYDFSE